MKIPYRDNRADWVKVIETMYEANLSDYSQSFSSKREYRELEYQGIYLKSPNITNKIDGDIDKIIVYLGELNLIRISTINAATSTEHKNYQLTQEGLQLAHQIKTERQRRNTNILLLILTAILTGLTVGLIAIEIAPIFFESLIEKGEM